MTRDYAESLIEAAEILSRDRCRPDAANSVFAQGKATATPILTRHIVAVLSYKEFPFMQGATVIVRWDADEDRIGGGMSWNEVYVAVHPWSFVRMTAEMYGAINGLNMLKSLMHDHIDRLAIQSKADLMRKWAADDKMKRFKELGILEYDRGQG